MATPKDKPPLNFQGKPAEIGDVIRNSEGNLTTYGTPKQFEESLNPGLGFDPAYLLLAVPFLITIMARLVFSKKVHVFLKNVVKYSYRGLSYILLIVSVIAVLWFMVTIIKSSRAYKGQTAKEWAEESDYWEASAGYWTKEAENFESRLEKLEKCIDSTKLIITDDPEYAYFVLDDCTD